MFENYTFFKNPTGGMYGVSSRVINTGFIPDASHVEATPQEKEDFIRRAVELKALGQPKTLEVKELPAKTPQNLPINFVVEEFKPKPIVLSPTEQKKQAFFETLTEDEVSYYEGLSNQGLSAAQLYKIKVAKDSKTIERRA